MPPKNKTEHLSFDSAKHEYAWQGSPLLSVTQSIKAAGLIDTTWFTDYARQRGRAVHMATEFDDQGDLDFESLSDVIKPYVLAARRFREDTGFIPELIEHRICLPESGYAGTLDRYGVMKDGSKAVVDYKTNSLPKWGGYQLAAYANALPEGPMLSRYVVQLLDSGTYKIHSYPAKDFRSDLNDFLCFVRVAQLQRELACLHS